MVVVGRGFERRGGYSSAVVVIEINDCGSCGSITVGVQLFVEGMYFDKMIVKPRSQELLGWREKKMRLCFVGCLCVVVTISESLLRW